MRFSILKANRRSLARGGAVLLVAGMAAGCSSGVSRFGGGGVDDIFTASTPNQRSIINQQPQQQPFPGDAQIATPVASASAGSVSRGSLQPVSSQPLPAPVAQAPALAPAPVRAAQAPAQAPALAPALDNRSTGTIAQPQTAQDNTLKVPGKNPQPATLPSNKVAVLPQQPKTKETATAQLGSPTDSNAKPAGAGGGYKVVEGDTLNRIAKKLGVSTAVLKEANSLQDGRIRIGQTLKVPAGGATSTVAKAAPAVDPVVTATAATAAPKPAVAAAKPAAETPAVAAYTPPKKDKLVQQAEESAEAAPNATGIDRMRWPVRGRVVSNYGKGGGKSNDGIDISVPEGTPVKAAENGVVIYAGDGLKEFGNTVLVRHENGLVTVYGHASSLKVQRGQKVKRGDEIALSGMSGSTDAPKLHFEVRKNSTPVDPSGYLE
ncbi:M23 family metallopeptidase [Aminobacter sp. SR38]|jgi:murein DD-endopeptidase MepM/ murein hydrolase activator NlpD|uniref:peptidoglycan DD-metalloendopeptidase family protein n=1 Tax=Aminobacter sp. SR38 TaxID=2774562 RepID=UPI0017816975|nr:M23 family metallopeptidase [Aminobacter sp. SR38]QOF71524.1 M23 family metallopeptidase [Aminobacter sp. SR38]